MSNGLAYMKSTKTLDESYYALLTLPQNSPFECCTHGYIGKTQIYKENELSPESMTAINQVFHQSQSEQWFSLHEIY